MYSTLNFDSPVKFVLTFHPAPTAQVSNVTAEWVNNRAALVSWTPLTLHEARGFPVYFVTYQPSSQVGQTENVNNTVNTNHSSVVIGDLDPTTEYIITVDVGTAGGKIRSPLGKSKPKFLIFYYRRFNLSYMLCVNCGTYIHVFVW